MEHENNKKEESKAEDLIGGIPTAEISEVTIVEYRKNQIVRLAECFVISPLCIYVGVKYRKQLPTWLSVTLIVAGTASLAYNGYNFYKNWNRDGKLIREAIKNKKVEEARVREERKKYTAEKTTDVKEENPPKEEVKNNNDQRSSEVDSDLVTVSVMNLNGKSKGALSTVQTKEVQVNNTDAVVITNEPHTKEKIIIVEEMKSGIVVTEEVKDGKSESE